MFVYSLQSVSVVSAVSEGATDRVLYMNDLTLGA